MGMKIGFIGLGKMGTRITEKLLKEGHEIVAWNRTPKELKTATTIQELVENLEKPRVIWSMLPAGSATQTILNEVGQFVGEGDIVIDGGNAHYQDSEKRFQEFKKKGIKFLGIGVSGGLRAGKNGYPLMVGGDKSAYEYLTPILDSLSKPHGGHEYFGEGGAGHFVKMVHNGIEYGMMQAIGEGFGVLEKAEYSFDLFKVAKLWQKGTIISGFLIDRATDVLSKDQKLSEIEGIIEESGEAKWTVEEAKRLNVPIENIEQSLEFRKKSQTDESVQKSFAAKLVAALRKEFGGHEVKKK